MVQTKPLKDTWNYKPMLSKTALLLLLTLGAFSVPETVKEGNLHRIYGVNFERFLKSHPTTLFVIYDNSPFSEQVLQTLDKLQPALAEKGFGELQIAKMEARSAPRWVHLWRAHDRPFLRLYVGDQLFSDFRHFPSFQNLFDWVSSSLGADTSLIEIDSEDKKQQFLAENLAFYMRFPADEREHYLSLLRNFRKLDPALKVYFTTNRLLDAFDKFHANDVVVGFQRRFDDGLKVMAHDKRVATETLQRFFDVYRSPDVHAASPELIQEVLSKKRKAVILFDDGKSKKPLKAFKDAAFKNKEKFLFVHANSTSEAGQQLSGVLGVEETEVPAIRVVYYPANEFRTFAVTVGDEEQISAQLDEFLKSTAQEIKEKQVEGESAEKPIDAETVESRNEIPRDEL